jgi:hypothetical protein
MRTLQDQAAYMRAWRAANPDKNRACRRSEQNSQAGRARRAAWAASFECKVHRKLSKHRKRARSWGLTEHFTLADARRMFAQQESCCFYCLVTLDPLGEWNFAHRVDIRDGGPNTADNVVVSCASSACNPRGGRPAKR